MCPFRGPSSNTINILRRVSSHSRRFTGVDCKTWFFLLVRAPHRQILACVVTTLPQPQHTCVARIHSFNNIHTLHSTPIICCRLAVQNSALLMAVQSTNLLPIAFMSGTAIDHLCLEGPGQKLFNFPKPWDEQIRMACHTHGCAWQVDKCTARLARPSPCALGRQLHQQLIAFSAASIANVIDHPVH